MKPLIFAFFMIIQCQGTENKDREEYKHKDYIEELIGDFVENLVQVIGEDSSLRVTFIGINDDGDVFIEEDIDEDDLQVFLQEREG